jgi:hypothetical protein
VLNGDTPFDLWNGGQTIPNFDEMLAVRNHAEHASPFRLSTHWVWAHHMNPFLLGGDEQIAAGRRCAKKCERSTSPLLSSGSPNTGRSAPLMKCAYDGEDCSEWPGPWEMIHNCDWCPYSVAIGMEFTLRLAGWDKSRLVSRPSVTTTFPTSA